MTRPLSKPEALRLTTRAIVAFCLEALRLRKARYRWARHVTADVNGSRRRFP